MNENIDLTKILKDCPKWTKFYSYVHGEVEFVEVTNLRCPIHIMTFSKDGNSISTFLTKEGYISEHYSNQSCILVPSLEQPDWSKFSAPWYKKEIFDPNTLKPFDKVLVFTNGEWTCDFFSHTLSGDIFNKRCMGIGDVNVVIPYNDETKHLVGTTDEAPEFYRYWED